MARRAALGGHAVAPGQCDNLTALADLNEDTLLKELEIRYNRDVIYTYVGEILVAVNPYFRIPELYDQSQKLKYRGGIDRESLPPHIFAVADAAVSALQSTGKNQVCVISGESGAGKTESAKLFLQHIIDLSAGSETEGIADKIIAVNPLLEAFGNASTLMNDNSSRFGKYLDLQFTENFTVRGALITEYLLEKSRVTYQADGEQNFHIFYYIFAGLDASAKAQYELGSAEDHGYINGNAEALAFIGTKECRDMWQEVSACFDLVGFSQGEKDNLFAILSGVLWLGDVLFDGEDHASIVSPSSILEAACNQLGLEVGVMEAALVEQILITGGEETTKALRTDQAVDVRDATAKALYGRAFTWIIKRVNSLTGPKGRGTGQIISFLDIFGFEHFDDNSLEQLCINLANEQLQSFFNSHIFQMELDEYKKEGIDGSQVSFTDNQATLDMLLSRRPPGILAIMDEQAIMPRSTDQTMVEKFHETFGSHSSYIKPRSNDAIFTIRHYAGDVCYNADGFLEKNRDTLAMDVLGALRMSENSLVRELFDGDADDAKAAKGKRGKRGGGRGLSRNNMRMSVKKARAAEAKKQRKSVGATFKESLEKLMTSLNSSAPHFIRCIKPNQSKQKHMYADQLVKNQLRYTGMLETTRIRKEGYAVRPTFEDFLHRYMPLTFAWGIGQSANAGACRMLLEKAKLKDWQIGKTKVFLRYYHPDELNDLVKPIAGAAAVLQKVTRGFLGRREVQKLMAEKQRVVDAVDKFILTIERHGTSIRDAVSSFNEADSKRDWSTPKPDAAPMSYESHTPRAAASSKSGLKRNQSVKWFKEQEKTKGHGMADDNNEGGVGGFAKWFHGVVSRVHSESLLGKQPVGTFLIRVAETRFGYSLSVRTPARIKHFMIDQSPDGQYMVVGNDRLFPSLNDLVTHYRHSPLTEDGDKLTHPCPGNEETVQELM